MRVVSAVDVTQMMTIQPIAIRIVAVAVLAAAVNTTHLDRTMHKAVGSNCVKFV